MSGERWPVPRDCTERPLPVPSETVTNDQSSPAPGPVDQSGMLNRNLPSPAPRKVLVTTSWDDGQETDFPVMELLSEFGLKATFYIPLSIEGRPTPLSHALARIPRDFEVGSHTATHRDLRYLDEPSLRREVEIGKTQLEDRLGSPVRVFAYPMGRHNARARRVVQQAGFLAARTTLEYQVENSFDAYRMPTTLCAFPLALPTRLRREFLRLRWSNVPFLARYWKHDWVELAIQLFEQAKRDRGVWHLWGHSQDIEKLGLWDQLREVFRVIANHPDACYCTNGELFSRLPAETRPAETEHPIG